MGGEISVGMDAVAQTSRAWDEKAGEMDATVTRLDGAATNGFPPAVAGAAAQFASTWGGFAESLSAQAELFGDQLRAALGSYLASDQASSGDLVVLGSYLDEGRR